MSLQKSAEIDKSDAKDFLLSLEEYLDTTLPPRDEICVKIDEEVALAVAERKFGPKLKSHHISSPEGAFFKLFGIDYIHRFLRTELKLSETQAREALLSESYRHRRNFSSNSPRSKEKHPFTKRMGENAAAIAARWWNKGNEPAVQQSCPDLALRFPSPYRVVIEGKYFRAGSDVASKSELVRDIYQCFYYRAMPPCPEWKTHPAWDYDFACLLAYDASNDGALKRAWKGVNKDVTGGLWRGANIYVMVIRGKN
jgi:hypothetical protein